MKCKFNRIMGIFLVVALLMPCFTACDSKTADTLRFPSEENMREYLTGTFSGNDVNFIIDGDKITKVDLTKIYPNSDADLESEVKRLSSYIENLNQLQFDEFLGLCQYLPEDHTIVSYDYKKGIIVCDDTTYTIDTDGNLVHGTSIYTWQSNSVTYPTADMKNRFSDYATLLLETSKIDEYTFNDYIDGMRAWMSRAGLDQPTYKTSKGVDKDQTVYSGSFLNDLGTFTVSSRNGYIDLISTLLPVPETQSIDVFEAYMDNTLNALLVHLPKDTAKTVYNGLVNSAKMSSDGVTLKGSYTYGKWKYSFKFISLMLTAEAEYIG